MSQAQRVPTAADVERWGDKWWFEHEPGYPTMAFLWVENTEVWARDECWREDGKELPSDPCFGTWLGPVNPEPLPWPTSP